MPKRTLDFNQPIKGYDGVNLIDPTDQAGKRPFTLKNALSSYFMNAHVMGLSDQDQHIIHTVGFLVGMSDGVEVLTTEQYDSLKRMTDKCGVISEQGMNKPIFPNVVTFQVKEMVDAAVEKKEVEKKEKE